MLNVYEKKIKKFPSSPPAIGNVQNLTNICTYISLSLFQISQSEFQWCFSYR